MKMEQCVPKRRHIKFRRQGITQKKGYNIQNTAKVWNQEYNFFVFVNEISLSHRSLPTQQTNIHAFRGIRTSDFRKQRAATYALDRTTTVIGRNILI